MGAGASVGAYLAVLCKGVSLRTSSCSGKKILRTSTTTLGVLESDEADGRQYLARLSFASGWSIMTIIIIIIDELQLLTLQR